MAKDINTLSRPKLASVDSSHVKDINILNINGYTVVHIHKNVKAPRVQSMIKSGSFAEKKSNSGVSHLLEHMLLDSWRKCRGDCTKYWGDKGISFNAFTGGTIVSYFINGLEKYERDMVDFICDITTGPKYDDEIIRKSKDAVREELLNYSNNPSWIMDNVFLNRLYPNKKNGLHYRDDWKLQIENLDNLDHKTIIEFFKKWYRKNNMIFSIVTKMDKHKVKEMFSKYLKPLKRDIKIVPSCPRPKQSITFVNWKDAKKTTFRVGFVSKITPNDDDVYYTDLIADILVGDMSSYLYHILRDKMNLIYEIDLSFETNYCNIAPIFEFSCNDKNAELLLTTFVKLMKKFLKSDYDDFQFNRAKERLLLKKYETCQNTNFLGTFYGSQVIYGRKNKIITPDSLMNKIDEISKEKLTKISRKFFEIDTMVIVYQARKKMKNSINI